MVLLLPRGPVPRLWQSTGQSTGCGCPLMWLASVRQLHTVVGVPLGVVFRVVDVGRLGRVHDVWRRFRGCWGARKRWGPSGDSGGFHATPAGFSPWCAHREEGGGALAASRFAPLLGLGGGSNEDGGGVLTASFWGSTEAPCHNQPPLAWPKYGHSPGGETTEGRVVVGLVVSTRGRRHDLVELRDVGVANVGASTWPS